MSKSVAMGKDLSVYLDLVRFLAAVGVFFSHFYPQIFTTIDLTWRFNAYGNISVIVFFVLSGYVIAHVVATRENSAILYTASRFSRLYSVVLIALALTYIFDIAGMYFKPELYTLHRIIPKPENLRDYVLTALFVNEYQGFNFGGVIPGTNAPFWSLSYEATYYLIAGILLFSRRIIAIPISLIILCIAGRTIIALLPIWTLGYGLYHFNKIQLQKVVSWLLLLASILALDQIPALTWNPHFPVDNFGAYFPWNQGLANRILARDYLVAGAFAVHLIAARELLRDVSFIRFIPEKFIRWLGSLTFPLYCVHYPVMCFLLAVSPWKIDQVGNLLFIMFFTFAITVAITPICNVFRDWIRARVMDFWPNGLLNRVNIER